MHYEELLGFSSPRWRTATAKKKGGFLVEISSGPERDVSPVHSAPPDTTALLRDVLVHLSRFLQATKEPGTSLLLVLSLCLCP